MPLLSRRTALRTMLGGGVGLVTGAAVYAYAYERIRLGITRESLPVSGLPSGLEGLRIGLLTDLHHSAFTSLDEINRAVNLLGSERPDLIVLGGDYVNFGDRRYMEPCAQVLGRLRSPYGVFAILGNHDDERHASSALTDVGIEVLRDARTAITIRGDQLSLAGLRFWTRKISDILRVIRGAKAPVLLLAHDPRRLREAAELDVPLVLSGHTHGGQIVLPIFGPVAARRFPLASGTANLYNTTIFVSRGIGTVYIPFRWNCPPEVAILTLVTRGQL